MLGSKPLRDNPVVQSKVAVAEAQWQSSRAFLMQALGDMWGTTCRGELDKSVERRARDAERHAGEGRAVDLIGGEPIKWAADRDRLSFRRRHGNFRKPTVRTAAARCARGDAAGAGPVRQLRGGRPGAARTSGHIEIIPCRHSPWSRRPYKSFRPPPCIAEIAIARAAA